MDDDVKRTISETARALEDSPPPVKAFVGFDGFVDSIIHVVDKRQDYSNFTRVNTISEFASRIAGAAGLSANIEFVVTDTKLGGNGPIYANALCDLGVKLTYVGSVGSLDEPAHPVFKNLAEKADVIPICQPALTDALEFSDGKIMLGKHSTLKNVSWDNLLLGAGGLENLTALINGADLIGMENWTMLPRMTYIWENLLKKVVPQLNAKATPPIAFFDLADPEKRAKEDILHALDLIKAFDGPFRAALGLNEKEAREIALLFDENAGSAPLKDVTALLYENLNIYCLAVHPVKEAFAACGGEVFHMPGPYCQNPVLTTGAGDNFNAGFCRGLTLGLDALRSLAAGVFTSGYYVRNAKSPTTAELSQFMKAYVE